MSARARSRVLIGRPPVGVRFFEHTADSGIEVSAPTLAGCFARAAAGMFATFTAPLSGTVPTIAVSVDVAGKGTEDLLVAWLEELLFQSEIKGVALHDISVLKLSGSSVRGIARGARFGRGVEAIGPAVKAVTRHGLEVHRHDGRWMVRIIFDV